MSRSERLEPIADLQRDKETEATRVLGEFQRSYLAQERRLAELELYQREYQQRFHALGNTGAAIERFREYRQFSEKLNHAIQQQRRLVEECRRELELQNRSWSEISSRRRALDKVIDRFRLEEVAQAQRREQRESDDRAQRMRRSLDGER
jgi:flagellar FliJ protein